MLNKRFHPLFGDELKGRWTDQPAWERPRSSNFVWSAARSIVFTPAIVCSWTQHVVQPSALKSTSQATSWPTKNP
jgi:hypothetical protein